MIVTRFAPSPTGYLHIGGARTALFCFLAARKGSGKFILRMEDTDQKRNTPTAAQQVMKDLAWLGIMWDEGPEVGGENGPYYQSERLDIYNKYMQQLLDSGRAYYCFDTPEELQIQREKAQQDKRTYTYDRPEVLPDVAAVERAEKEGRPVVVRFAMPGNDIVVQDVVRGGVRFGAAEIGDFIIQKSDGFPTYHFACVVDDELMGVTHILRGQEHLMNTPGHIALQEALGFRRPVYAHMSVTISEGGGKLSKRERGKVLRQAIKEAEGLDHAELAQVGGVSVEEFAGFLNKKNELDGPNITAIAEHIHVHLPEINVVDFLHSGYIPEALVNFVSLLGWNPGDNREIMPIEELIEAFDINRLNKTNSLFDRKKLISFNTEHMRIIAPEKLLEHFKRYLEVVESPIGKADDKTLAHLLKICEGARTLEDVATKSMFLFVDKVEFDEKAVKKVLQKDGVAELMKLTQSALAALETWDAHSLHGAIEKLCEEHQVGMGKVAQPLRVAITGTMVSPPIDESLMLLGKERTLKRIDDTLEFIS